MAYFGTFILSLYEQPKNTSTFPFLASLGLSRELHQINSAKDLVFVETAISLGYCFALVVKIENE